MMETNVPKDIRVYKTKIFGPFTIRQVVCISICIALDLFAISMITKVSELSIQAIIYLLMFMDIPIMIFIFDKDGMPMEKYLTKVIIPNFISPAKRKAETRFSSEIAVNASNKKKKKKKGKIDSIYIPYE